MSDKEKKAKSKRVIPLRQAGETVEKPENRPSKRLFDEVKRETERLELATPSTPLHPLPPPTTPYQAEIIQQPVSPSSNYFKTSNDEVDEAIRLGLFKGTSYETYKILFRQTRGHISQRRSIKITFSEIEKLTGVSHNTLRGHLKWLENSHWIHRDYKLGDNTGVEIEIRTYSEIKHLLPTPSPTTSYHPLLPGTTTYQNVGGGTTQNLEGGGGGLTPENIEENGSLRLSFKTLTYIDDDAPVINLLEKFNGMARKLTGKNLTKKDLEKLSDVAEMLITETIIAAARTDSVSASISFMAENLRRRLYSKPKTTDRKGQRPMSLDVGRGIQQRVEDITTASQPQMQLSEQQRENTLNALREAKAANTIFFREFKTYGEIEYTEEDLKWLVENLEKGRDESITSKETD